MARSLTSTVALAGAANQNSGAQIYVVRVFGDICDIGDHLYDIRHLAPALFRHLFYASDLLDLSAHVALAHHFPIRVARDLTRDKNHAGALDRNDLRVKRLTYEIVGAPLRLGLAYLLIFFSIH